MKLDIKEITQKEKELIIFLGGYGFKWLRNDAQIFPGPKNCIVAFAKTNGVGVTWEKNMAFIREKVKGFGMEVVGDVLQTPDGILMAFKEVE